MAATVGVLTALGAAIRIVFFFEFDNVLSWESEAYSKINLVYTWISLGKSYPDTNFGPLHTWLIYLIAWPFEDRVTPVRVFSILCSMATIPFFFAAIRRQTDERVALAATALFAFYPLHVRAGATSLAEAPYVLSFFVGLWAFLVYQDEPERSFAWLAGSALALTAGAMLRFESWLFYPVFCLWALRRGSLRAVGYGALLVLFPAFHMYMCWRISGNPVSFGETSARTFALYLPQMPLSYKALGWFVAFWNILGPATAVIAPFGFLWAATKSRAGVVFTLFVVPYAFMSVRTLMGQMDPALLRYGIILGALLIPFAAAAIVHGPRRLPIPAGLARALPVALVVALAAGQIAWAVDQSNQSALPDDVRAVAVFLRDETPRADKALIDKRFHPYIVIESRKDPSRLLNLEYVGAPVDEWERYRELVLRFFPLSYIDGREPTWGRDIKLYDRAAYLELMDREHPRWLVIDYESAGNIQAIPIDPWTETAEIDGRRYGRVFRQGDFAIFRIEEDVPSGTGTGTGGALSAVIPTESRPRGCRGARDEWRNPLTTIPEPSRDSSTPLRSARIDRRLSGTGGAA